jgi:hypothetical protein
MFRHNRHLQGAYTNVVKTCRSILVLKYTVCRTVHLLVLIEFVIPLAT